MIKNLKILFLASSSVYCAMIGSVMAGSCVFVSAGVYSCSGPAATDTEVSLSSSGSLIVNTTPDFGLNTDLGSGFYLYISGGSGDISFNGMGTGPITGADSGIIAVNDGTGSTSITATGTVSGNSSFGISAENYGAGLTINAVDVSGGFQGIYATNGGTGSTSITTTGTVTGSSETGILASNQGALSTDLTINVVNVSGGLRGIFAMNNGTGSTSITVGGTLVGTSAEGILFLDFTPIGGADNSISVASGGVIEGAISGISVISIYDTRATSIVNEGIVRNISGLSTDIAIIGHTIDPSATIIGDTRLSIKNSGLITGIVELGDLGNSLTNTGVWNTAGGTNEFGAGSNDLINNGLIKAAADTGTAVTTTFNGLTRFTNNAGGVLSMNNGIAGDRTILSGDYIGNGGTIALDTVLGDDSSATDRFVINGNTSGSSNVKVTKVGGSGAQTVEGIKIIEVSGASAAAFTLLGDYVHEGQQAVISGAYAYTCNKEAPKLQLMATGISFRR